MNRVRTLLNKLFVKYSLVTNVATNSLMATVGDLIEQQSPWNEHADKNDWHRTRTVTSLKLKRRFDATIESIILI